MWNGLWKLVTMPAQKKWSRGEYKYIYVHLCVHWFSVVVYSTLGSASCQNCDTIWIVATFINQTICHCKINLILGFSFSWDNREHPKVNKLSIQCDKPNTNILGTGSYLILHNRGQNTKWKKEIFIIAAHRIISKVKSISSNWRWENRTFVKGCYCLPHHCQGLGSSRIKSQKLKILNDSIWHTNYCDSCWTSHVFIEGKSLFYKAFLGLSARLCLFQVFSKLIKDIHNHWVQHSGISPNNEKTVIEKSNSVVFQTLFNALLFHYLKLPQYHDDGEEII